MNLFRRRKADNGPRPGDVYRKCGAFSVDWVVDRIFDYPDIPRHARLTERNDRRTMTVAVSFLMDPEFFTQIPPAPHEDA